MALPFDVRLLSVLAMVDRRSCCERISIAGPCLCCVRYVQVCVVCGVGDQLKGLNKNKIKQVGEEIRHVFEGLGDGQFELNVCSIAVLLLLSCGINGLEQ